MSPDQIPYLDFDGRGPVLHFAHANSYPPGCYRQLLQALAPRFRVLAMQHRPLWPGSQPESMTDWRIMGDDLIRFMDQHELRGVYGVGHSMGAVASLYAGIKRPDLFSALVFIEPVFFAPDVLHAIGAQAHGDLLHDFPLVRTALNRRAHWPSRAAAFSHLRPKRVFARLSDAALWDYVNYGLHQDETGQVVLSYPAAWEARVYSLPPTDVWDLLPRLTMPVLAVRGEETDTLMPPAWTLWQQLQPQATFRELADADHLLPFSHPQRLAQIILDFAPPTA
ncbi:MAG: alpha/beta hydrolase [Anaerolineales bacterium]|nr:alpha/beta hydrolase [Anaerolineales bacterium]MCB8950660.1 alpha/beta hydrolase [Ardenticatenales bacterium]